MNLAHGNASIVLHMVAYAGGMIALFALARYAIVARNWAAGKMGFARQDVGEMGEKSIGLSDGLDTWSSEMDIPVPVPVQTQRSLGYCVYRVRIS